MLRRMFFKTIAGVLAAPYIGLALRPLAQRWVPNVWLGRSTCWTDPRNWTLGHVPRNDESVVFRLNGGRLVTANLDQSHTKLASLTITETSGVRIGTVRQPLITKKGQDATHLRD